MKKTLAILLSVLMLMSLLTACGQEPTQSDVSDTPVPKADVNVVAIAGPTGVGLVKLMENNKNGTAANNYHFTVVSDPQQAVAAVSNGSANIAAVPTNLHVTACLFIER